MFYLRLSLILALCGLLVQPAQAATPQKTEPKEITIYILGEHKAVVAALVDAVGEETTITGIADFDALSTTYGLIGIYRMGRMSPFFSGYRFRLMFPPGVDMAAIAGAYWNLPYVQSVEPKPPPRARVQKLVQSQDESGDFSMVKERIRPFDLENAELRILKKVAIGTFSGIVFTGMAMGVQEKIWEPTGGSDAYSFRTISLLLNGLLWGSWVGFPLGVTAVDPYDSLPKTLLAGVIPPVLAGYALAIASEEMEDIGVPLMYVGPIIGSLYASEKWRKPPQDRRVSFGLAPALNGGLSATATLRF